MSNEFVVKKGLILNNQAPVKFTDASGTIYVAVQAPSAVSSGNVNITLPGSYGASGQILATNSSGTLSWVTPVSITSGSVTSGYIGDNAVLSGSIGSGQISKFHIASGQVVKGLNQGSNVSITVDANDVYTISATISGSVAVEPLTIASGLSLNSGTIYNGSVAMTLGVSSGGIVSNLIADNAVTSGKIASGTIGSIHVSSGGIQSVNLANNSVTSGSIASGSIGTYHFSSGATINNALTLNGTVWERYEEQQNTGLLYGGEISFLSGTNTIIVASGEGIISTPRVGASGTPESVYVSWGLTSGLTIPISSGNVTYVSVKSGGTFVTQNDAFTITEYLEQITLGYVLHPNNVNIQEIHSQPNVSYACVSQLNLFARVFGPLKVSGLSIVPNGANLQVNRAAGYAFAFGSNYTNDQNNPSITTENSKITVNMYYIYRAAAAGQYTFTTSPVTNVGVANYDNGTGTLATVTVNQWTIQRVFYIPEDTNNVYIYYGRATYGNSATASQNIFLEAFDEDPFTSAACVFLGYIISRGGASALNNTSDAIFIQAGNFRNSAGGGGGTGGLSLDDLTDVTLSSSAESQVLTYSAGVWRNAYVKSGSIASGQIGTYHIAQGAITDGLIASGAITSGMIGNNAVFNNNIASGGVGSGKLADGSIVSGSIASGQIGSIHLASGVVVGFLTSGIITSGMIGNNAVVSGSIASGSIGTYHFSSGATINNALTLNNVIWDRYQEQLKTGLLYGGSLSYISGTTTISISSGQGVIAKPRVGASGEPQLTYVNWGLQSGISIPIASGQVSYISIRSGGTAVTQNDEVTINEYLDQIILGYALHPTGTNIDSVQTHPTLAYACVSQVNEFARIFGPLKVSGLAIVPNGANLQINRAAGYSFLFGANYLVDPNNPSVTTENAKTTAGMRYIYRSSVAGQYIVATTAVTNLIPASWDDGTGTLGVVTTNQWTIQRLFYIPGDTDNVYIYYGIVKYNSYSAASQNIFLEQFTESQFTESACLFIGYIISRGGATQLNDTNDAIFIQAGAFRNTAGGGGGTGGLALDDLTDVSISTATNDQVLVYDTGVWRNAYVKSGSIASGQIGTYHIAQGAITDGLIASGAITSGMIGNNAVFNNNIVSGGVGSGKLADGSVYNNIIASGGIGSGKLADGSVYNNIIASGGINSGKLGNAVVVSGNIASGQIGLVHLASGTVFSGTFVASGTVQSGSLGNASVVSGSIASGQIGANHLASGVISTATLGSGQVTSGVIASGSISSFNLSSGVVQSGHIGNNAVVSGSIASGSIAGPHLASGVINAISGNVAITSGSLSVNTIFATSGNVGVGTDLTLRAANAVTSGAGGSIILQPGTQSVTGGNGYVILINPANPANQVSFKFNGTTLDVNQSGITSINFGNIYEPSFNRVNFGSATHLINSNQFQLGQNCHVTWNQGTYWQAPYGDVGLKRATPNTLMLTNASSGGGSFAYTPTTTIINSNTNNLSLDGSAFQRLNVTSGSTITGLSFVSGGAHVDGRFIRLANVGTQNLTLSNQDVLSSGNNRFYNYTSGNIVLGPNRFVDAVYDSTTGGWRVYGDNYPYVLPTTNGTSGQLLTTNGVNNLAWANGFALTSGSVTSGFIGDNSINSGNISSGQVNGNHLASGTVLTQLTSGIITSGMIGNNAVVSGSIASGQIGKNHLISGLITTLTLGSGQVTSGNIASGSVGRFHLSDNSVYSGNIAANQIGQGHIGSGLLFGLNLYQDQTALGANALSFATSGRNNTAIGYLSQRLIANGTNNTTLGSYTIFSMSNGTQNTAIGGYSLNAMVQGNYNDALGYFTLANMQSGEFNVAIGANAGSQISGGNNLLIANRSIFIGYQTKPANNDQINQIAIGFQAIGDGSNTTVIGNSSTTSGQIYGNIKFPHGLSWSSGYIASGGSLVSTFGSGIIVSGNIGNNSVNSGNISSGSVGLVHLASGTVFSGTFLLSGNVTSGYIANNSVNSGSITSGVISNIHIASGGLTSGAISSGSIGSVHLAEGAVQSGDISSGQIGVNHLISGLITTLTLGSGQVTSGNIASGVVFRLLSGSVTSGFIGDNAVNSGNISSGQIFTLHIASGGLLSGAIGSGQIGQFHFSSGTVSKFTSSASTPSNPNEGDRWYYTTDGILLTYVNDGTSSQWVQF